jgi:hypothetical protein
MSLNQSRNLLTIVSSQKQKEVMEVVAGFGKNARDRIWKYCGRRSRTGKWLRVGDVSVLVVSICLVYREDRHVQDVTFQTNRSIEGSSTRSETTEYSDLFSIAV